MKTSVSVRLIFSLFLISSLAILVTTNQLSSKDYTPTHRVEDPQTIPTLYTETFVMSDYSFWNASYGGSDWDKIHSVIECSTGGYVFAGYTYSFGAGGCDLWLARVDSTGQLLWNFTYGGTNDDKAYDLVECTDGGFVLVGSTASYGNGGWDAWLVRTDSSGLCLWNKTFGGVNYDEARSIVLTHDHGFALAGTYSYGQTGWDFWLIRTDSSGNHLWNRTYGGEWDDMAYSLVECNSGGFAISGSTESYGAGEYDFWLIRTNPEGELTWNRTYGGPGYEEAWSLIECSDGGFAMAGDTTEISVSHHQPLIVRTDPLGLAIWNYTTASKYRSLSLLEDQYQHIVFTTKGSGLVIVRLNPQGSPVWEFDSHQGTWAHSLIQSSDGSFVVAGYDSVNLVAGPKNFEYNGSIIKLMNPPFLIEQPESQVIELGEPYLYDLNVSIPHGVSDWWLEGCAGFQIDTEGVIRNSTNLSTGSYDIVAVVNDTLDNRLTVTVTLDVEDTTPPIWIHVSEDQYVTFGDRLRYDLNASDLNELVLWNLNDTENFSIDTEGIVTDTEILAVGSYGLRISVYDASDNLLQGEFTVYVQTDTATTDPTDFLYLAIVIVGLAGVVVFVIIYFIKRKPRSQKPTA